MTNEPTTSPSLKRLVRVILIGPLPSASRPGTDREAEGRGPMRITRTNLLSLGLVIGSFVITAARLPGRAFPERLRDPSGDAPRLLVHGDDAGVARGHRRPGADQSRDSSGNRSALHRRR